MLLNPIPSAGLPKPKLRNETTSESFKAVVIEPESEAEWTSGYAGAEKLVSYYLQYCRVEVTKFMGL